MEFIITARSVLNKSNKKSMLNIIHLVDPRIKGILIKPSTLGNC